MRDDWNTWLQERAYALWERSNRPDGRHEEHWRIAEEELRQSSPPAKHPLMAENEKPS